MQKLIDLKKSLNSKTKELQNINKNPIDNKTFKPIESLHAFKLICFKSTNQQSVHPTQKSPAISRLLLRSIISCTNPNLIPFYIPNDNKTQHHLLYPYIFSNCILTVGTYFITFNRRIIFFYEIDLNFFFI